MLSMPRSSPLLLLLLATLCASLCLCVCAAPYARGASVPLIMRKKLGEFATPSDWVSVAAEQSPKFGVASIGDVPVHERAGKSKDDIKIQFHLPSERLTSPWFTFHDYSHETERFRQLVSVTVTLHYLGKAITDADWLVEESPYTNRDALVLLYHWEVNREETPELASAALALATLLCAVFLTAAILLGGFAEARLRQRTQRAATHTARTPEHSEDARDYALTKKDDAFFSADAGEARAPGAWPPAASPEPRTPALAYQRSTTPSTRSSVPHTFAVI